MTHTVTSIEVRIWSTKMADNQHFQYVNKPPYFKEVYGNWKRCLKATRTPAKNTGPGVPIWRRWLQKLAANDRNLHPVAILNSIARGTGTTSENNALPSHEVWKITIIHDFFLYSFWITFYRKIVYRGRSVIPARGLIYSMLIIA